jgi:hypothetical protein
MATDVLRASQLKARATDADVLETLDHRNETHGGRGVTRVERILKPIRTALLGETASLRKKGSSESAPR